mmetsp:Transcript_4989/g.13190  ORF Transcript_4989/g.13190 Transcript_4989/m.13190 type:complete len:269 (+) Transcript_4989:3-809(+)
MNELTAWAGFLAGDLERAGARLVSTRELLKHAEQRQASLEDHVHFLEWQCSQRRVGELEASIEHLRSELDAALERDLIAELTAAKDALATERARRAADEASVAQCQAENEEMRRAAATSAAEIKLAKVHVREETTRRAKADERARAEVARAEDLERRHIELTNSLAEATARAEQERIRAESAEAEAEAARLSAADASSAAGQLRRARDELQQARDQLALEGRARRQVEAKEIEVRHRLDAALRACKQASDEADTLRAKLRVATGNAGC